MGKKEINELSLVRADNIRRLQRRYKLGNKDFATKTKLSVSGISNSLNGNSNIGNRTVERVSTSFNIDPRTLDKDNRDLPEDALDSDGFQPRPPEETGDVMILLEFDGTQIEKPVHPSVAKAIINLLLFGDD